ncbi:MAG: malate dehydrogenase, partial [Thermoproteales archaeon]|nr:malate dehydrogenase [Thermoproteales archaeon]
SDFSNQVNNSLAFPAVFRGVLDVRACKISDEIIIAAALELAKHAEEKGLSEDYIIPTMEEWEIYPKVAAAVAYEAVKQNLARRPLSWEEELENAKKIIMRTRSIVKLFMEQGLIEPIEN